jgi:hypothetical protein
MEKLSSDVPSGSEGTVTYQAAVPDTNEEGDNSTTDVTFTAKFCDPYERRHRYPTTTRRSFALKL